MYCDQVIRKHEDLDILILRSDVNALIEALPDLDFFPSDPPGTLRPLLKGEDLPIHVQNVWAREDNESDWCLQLMINDHEGDNFLYKRDHSIKLPIKDHSLMSSQGIPYISPEFQLLHKAKSLRDKDQIDFDVCLEFLNLDQKNWLQTTMLKVYPKNHPWLEI